MKQVAVASGKEGVGKTTLVASFSAIQHAIIVDCDVDAPNLHIILKPDIDKKIAYEGMEIAQIDDGMQSAIKMKCEGYATCQLVCPVNAISMHKRKSGYIFAGKTRFGKFVYGLLIPEEASGKLVSQARRLAEEFIIIDAPPGIGCPVIASIGNTDLVVVVAEPSMAAIHDMKRILGIVEHLELKQKLRNFAIRKESKS